ncbi:MAG: hypothetical protein V3U56_14915 [Syntrophobacteria bacterium]
MKVQYNQFFLDPGSRPAAADLAGMTNCDTVYWGERGWDQVRHASAYYQQVKKVFDERGQPHHVPLLLVFRRPEMAI